MEAICTQYNLVLDNSTSFKTINSSCSWTNFMLAYPTTLLNLLLIISMVKSRELDKPCGLLILNLAITDLLNGFFDMPLFYMVFRFIAEGKDPCVFVNIAMPCFVAASFQSFVVVTLIAVERYISVLHPFMYVSQLSKRNVAICTIVSWTVSLLVIIPLLAGKNFASLIWLFFPVGIVGTAVNIYCYLKILYRARKTRLRIRNETARFSEANITSADRRFLFIGGLIILSMLACFSIAASAAFMSLLRYRADVIRDIRCWNWTLIMANSLINPIITCTFCPHIRRRMLRLLTCNVMYGEIQ